MTVVTIIHCDQCDSTEVLHEVVTGPTTEKHVKMSEVAQDRTSGMTAAVYYYTQYRLVCKSCGYILRYQR